MCQRHQNKVIFFQDAKQCFIQEARLNKPLLEMDGVKHDLYNNKAFADESSSMPEMVTISH